MIDSLMINGCKSDPLTRSRACQPCFRRAEHTDHSVECSRERCKAQAHGPGCGQNSGQVFCRARKKASRLMLGSRKAITAYWLPGFVQCLKDAGWADAVPTRFRAVPAWAQTIFGDFFASLVVGMGAWQTLNFIDKPTRWLSCCYHYQPKFKHF